jgi:hypothetical protein
MAENSEIAELQGETTEVELAKTLSQTSPLLPRSAWNSQLTYLKVLLKAKQALDKSERLGGMGNLENSSS